MQEKEEILFGKLAVEKGFITQEQLDECVEMQRLSGTTRLLGTILVRRGYLGKPQLREILRIQKRNLERPATHSKEKKRDVGFGFLAVKYGYATQDQVYECVREQAILSRKGLFFRLGEIFQHKEFLTEEQVEEILELQRSAVVDCPGCGIRVSVMKAEPGKKVRCVKCKHVFVVPEAAEKAIAEGGGEGAA